ncbi:transcriptional regulator family: Fungal Specific TF [Penicillium sp. DV-2018c]|nr:transcriptional regulator family: Fungal Specific TF [Penicillium sp. DV-2018c]KAJ5577201.1 transcriptional regulator family: Fungal Specific TF [Penicillium sp. DV-2018c]
MKDLLKSCLLNKNQSMNDPPTELGSSSSPKGIKNSQDTRHMPSGADISAATDIQPAPITVVRHVGSLITEPVITSENDSLLGNMTEMGLDSDNFAPVFQHGFEQISSWYPFPHETMTDLKQNNPLLFAICLLAGIRATAGLNRSDLHVTLYTMVKAHLGQKTLSTPVDLSTIHGMLIFSAWSFGPLVPGGKYIDSWLMSSTTVTHCLLSFPLPELVTRGELYDDTSRQMCRMWIQASLVHLKYAVGTGRPSLIPCERLHPWTEVVKYPGFEPFDQIIGAELKLYIHLYEAIYHATGSVGDSWEILNRWGRNYLADGNSALRWAHSCSSLILSRWELAKQNQSISPDSLIRTERLNELTETVIRHAQLVLQEIIVLCSSETAHVRPTYDYLLTAYAGVTLAEYCGSISDIHATYTLMENVRTQARIPRSIEGVFSWATNVVRKKARDMLDSKLPIAPDDTFFSYPASVADWAPFRFIDSMPASDWDMQQY